ncbi:MAG: hypothetical protein IKZ88_01065 [Neisseriaceae bacterium]|nr:hypothetical protein [Neisseriaceae bacterium]
MGKDAHPTKVQQRRRVGLPAHRNGRRQYNGRILFSGNLKRSSTNKVKLK